MEEDPQEDKKRLKKLLIGREALRKKGEEQPVESPVTRSTIVNMESMSMIWEHILAQDFAKQSSRLVNIVLADHALSKRQKRPELAEVFFERLNVHSLAILNGAILSLFSTGKTSGLLVEIGEGTMSAVPIHEGFALQQAALSCELAGQDVTDALNRSLSAMYGPSTLPLWEIANSLKIRLCQVVLNYDQAVTTPHKLLHE